MTGRGTGVQRPVVTAHLVDTRAVPDRSARDRRDGIAHDRRDGTVRGTGRNGRIAPWTRAPAPSPSLPT